MSDGEDQAKTRQEVKDEGCVRLQYHIMLGGHTWIFVHVYRSLHKPKKNEKALRTYQFRDADGMEWVKLDNVVCVWPSVFDLQPELLGCSTAGPFRCMAADPGSCAGSLRS